MKAKAPRRDQPIRTPATHENGSRTAVGLLGNRPEMVVQRKLHALARNSPQARRAAEWHDRANAGQRAAGRGQALPSDVLGKMERSFGADFSSVRVHEDPYAGSLGAVAATRGRDVHFAPGSYQPHTRRGQEVLGHELTHVVQQSQGRVRANTQAKGWAINDQPALEREADQMGTRAARGERADIGAPGHGTGETAVVQRLVASIPGGKWDEKDGPKDDKTFINTTLTAHAKVGGKIKRIDYTNFAADFVETDENLAITGHGRAGGIGSRSAQEVADFLTDSKTGLTADHHIPDTIHFENCYAAADPDSGDKVITKVQSELAAHLGESNVPTIIGPAGPQITTNRKAHGQQNPAIVKTVVHGDTKGIEFAAAARVQHCLYTKYFDAGEQINTRLDGTDDGQEFLKVAKRDQDKVSNLKWIFINVVNGTPLSKDKYDEIEAGLQKTLIDYWDSQNFAGATGGKSGEDIFKTGVDLRDPTGLVTL